MPLPSAADIILYTDSLASVLKQAYAVMGLDAPGETNTISSVADASRIKVVGDGTTTFPGLSGIEFKSAASNGLQSLRSAARYDQFFSRQCQGLAALLDAQVSANVPPGWNLRTTATQAHVFDLFLQRLNANHANTPAAPASAGTLSAISDSLGALPTVVSGSAPRIVHTLISASGDQFESLPSAQATQVALTGGQNAYSYQIAGTVPTGVAKVGIYRGYFAGGAGIYWYSHQVNVTAGVAYPAIKILTPDSTLRNDVVPPGYAGCLMTPEFAALFALAFAGSVGGALGAFGAGAAGDLRFSANSMLSPGNVALSRADGFVGVGNPLSSAIFGTHLLGTGYAAGAIQAANNSLSNVQGFFGASGTLQARVTTVLNGTCTPTVTYSYMSASGSGSASLALSAMSGTAVGSVATGAIPAGRIVTAITAISLSGTATTGQFVAEAVFPRTY